MRISDPKHPYQKHRRQHRATLRNPSDSQNAVRHWWTQRGTAEAQRDLDEMVKAVTTFNDDVAVIETDLQRLIAKHKERMERASANRTHESAREWGRVSRMWELYRGM